MASPQQTGDSMDVLEAQLLRSWKELEELESNLEASPANEGHYLKSKERWFAMASPFLRDLPEGQHCWCRHQRITQPFLEVFSNYSKDLKPESAVIYLWRRISKELRRCIPCIKLHHQGQAFFQDEYEEEVVLPIIEILQSLDKERVAEHLKDLQASKGKDSTEQDPTEFTCVIFEVLMFPYLLEDEGVDKLFKPILQFVVATHELSLAAGQRYPGLYALFFHADQSVRSIAIELADPLGKFRDAGDLESIQPVLQKLLNCLETDSFEENKQVLGRQRDAVKSEVSGGVDGVKAGPGRRRTVMKREAVWIGLQKLLSLLEPPAFEEGVVERYPAFVSMVLNNVSEATSTFTYPLRCLRLLLEVLGYKLWLSSTFSTGVMRNTLVGKCFQARDELLHNSIFELFEPFLQSLEGLQDGEYEKQRRRLLYFLLQQVPASSNFKPLIRAKANKIAFAVIGRGYMVEPPSPPLECTHVWGPSLIRTLKDISLHSSLRQPAIDLMQTIIVADVAALGGFSARQHSSLLLWKDLLDDERFDDDDLEPPVEAQLSSDDKFWISLQKLNSVVREGSDTWFCLPLVWMEGLNSLLPASVPSSFSKTVLWAASQLSLFNMDSQDVEADLLILHNGVAYSQGFEGALLWSPPRGCDDGDDGKPCPNSVSAKEYHADLTLALKRSAAAFCSVERRFERWVWESRMSEPIVLLLLDTDSSSRNLARDLLRHFSKATQQVCEELTLCTSQPAAMAASRGLLHAAKLLLAWPFPACSPGLQLLFFQAEKWLNVTKRMQGMDKHILWDMFCQTLSKYMWPLICKCLSTGKKYVTDASQQLTFVRMMDLLLLVCKQLPNTVKRRVFGQTGANSTVHNASLPRRNDLDWFRHLAGWGDVTVVSIQRRWKEVFGSLISNFMDKVFPVSDELIEIVQQLLDSGADMHDDYRQRLSVLLVSATDLRDQAAHIIPSYDLQWPGRSTRAFSKEFQEEVPEVSDKPIDVADDDVEILETPGIWIKDNRKSAVGTPMDRVLKDETRLEKGDTGLQVSLVGLDNKSSPRKSNEINETTAGKPQLPYKRPTVRKVPDPSAFSVKKNTTLDSFLLRSSSGQASGSKEATPQGPTLSFKSASASKSVRTSGNKNTSKLAAIRAEVRSDREQLAAVEGLVKSQVKDRIQKERGGAEPRATVPEGDTDHRSKLTEGGSGDTDARAADRMLEDFVRDVEVDPLERALDNVRKQSSKVVLESVVLPRRRVVCLGAPGEQQRPVYGRIPSASLTRPPPPKLDDWYRLILGLDYFATMGINTEPDVSEHDVTALANLPCTFKSPDHYLDIFRPWLIEEFKAQLQRAFQEMSLSDGMTTGSLTLMSLERIDDFQRAQFIAEAGADGAARACSENDLVLLTKRPFNKDGQSFHVLAKVDKRDRDKVNKAAITLVLRIYVNQGNARLAKAKRLLVDRSRWNMTRLLSITPQIREFQALSAVVSYPLLSTILCPSTKSGSSFQDQQFQNLKPLPEQLLLRLKKEFNESQLCAISAAIGKKTDHDRHQLALVQGPPGTGKTRTIIAIVSTLLALGYVRGENKYYPNIDNVYSNSQPQSSTTASRSAVDAAAIARSWQDARVAKDLMLQASSPTGVVKKQRVLICAQSNAAVDELVSRIRDYGLYGIDGHFYKPNLVRVGNAKSVHPKSLDVFIDTLIDRKLGEEGVMGDEGVKDQAGMLKAEFEQICEEIQTYEAAKAQCDVSEDNAERNREINVPDQSLTDDHEEIPNMGEKLGLPIKLLGSDGIDIKLKSLKRKKHKLYTELRNAEMRGKQVYEENKRKRDDIRRDLLAKAEVVVTTLNGCGGDIYSTCMESIAGNKRKSQADCFFDAVVVDEAAQALEPATLIPLQLLAHQRSRCVMVGDPKQLPATVLSQNASKMGFDRSMFERLQQAGYPVTLLSMQYRMHPEIRKFPSEHFYNNQLVDGETLTAGSRKANFHNHWCFKPYLFFDVVEGRERGGSTGQSLANEAEADVALELFRSFMQRYSTESISGRFGIITPYKQQLTVLRERFKRSLGQNVASDIEFNTVDGFQGREVDILILSTVRATSGMGGIGFVADVRRMNVALTRARFSLWIIGNSATLQSNPTWASLIANAISRGVLHSITRPYSSLLTAPGPPRIGSCHAAEHEGGHQVQVSAPPSMNRSRIEMSPVVEARYKKGRFDQIESTNGLEKGTERRTSKFSDPHILQPDQDQGADQLQGDKETAHQGRKGLVGQSRFTPSVPTDGAQRHSSRGRDRDRVDHGESPDLGHHQKSSNEGHRDVGRHRGSERHRNHERRQNDDMRQRRSWRQHEHETSATGGLTHGPMDSSRLDKNQDSWRERTGRNHLNRDAQRSDQVMQPFRMNASSRGGARELELVNHRDAVRIYGSGKSQSNSVDASTAPGQALRPSSSNPQHSNGMVIPLSSKTSLERTDDKVASRKRQRAEAEAIMRAGLLPSSNPVRRVTDPGRPPRPPSAGEALPRQLPQLPEGRQLHRGPKAGSLSPGGLGQVQHSRPASGGQVRQSTSGEPEQRTSVDDILSGLGALSASQVKGGRL